ncbi:ATP-binding protein, partial [Arthrospira platensis SPKY1]|nr:ATP-binding protein [Arthrospira platensis SPKY1]
MVEIEEINQVLIEIIGNACDSIHRAIASKQIVAGKIGVRTAQDGNRILIEITDNGVGMSEMVRQRMFDPYFTTKALGSGAGQGMA